MLTPDLQQLGVLLLLQAHHLRLKLQLQPLLQLLQLRLLLPAQLAHLLLKPPLQLLLLLLQFLTLGCTEGWREGGERHLLKKIGYKAPKASNPSAYNTHRQITKVNVISRARVSLSLL